MVEGGADAEAKARGDAGALLTGCRRRSGDR